MIYNFVWNLILGTKFSSIYLTKGEKRLVFLLSFVNLQRAKDGAHMFDAKYNMCFLYKSHQVARLVSTSLITFSNECLPYNKKMLLRLVAKLKLYTSFYIS